MILFYDKVRAPRLYPDSVEAPSHHRSYTRRREGRPTRRIDWCSDRIGYANHTCVTIIYEFFIVP